MELVKLHQLAETKIRQRVIDKLKNGALILYPTDTSYGLGVLPTNKQGVSKLLEIKRWRQKPISLLLNQKLISKYVRLNSYSNFLLDYFLPGKYTIISQLKEDKKQILDTRILANDNSLGWRFINLPLINQLIDQLDQPLTATSANLPDQPPIFSPTELKTISGKLKKKIDIIIDGGRLKPQPASIIIDTFIKPGRIIRTKPNILAPLILKTFTAVTEECLNQVTSFLSSWLEKNKPPQLVLLFGHLGAGKTTFVKHWLKTEKNYSGNVSSPSFTLINEYSLGQEKIIHLDLWRLEEKELDDLELTRYYQEPNLIFVEWAEKLLPTLIKRDYHQLPIIAIYFEVTSNNKRRISLFRLLQT